MASEVRSGSTFVAESIAYHFSKLFGDVLFDLTREQFSHLRAGSSHVDILKKFNSLYLGPQGWVAAKIMCAALSVIVRETRKHDALREAFLGPKTFWIIVRRKQRVRQAVSLAEARKSGEWHVYSTEVTKKDDQLISVAETEEALRAILLSDTYLESFSSLIAPNNKIEVYYEDFLTDPKVVIERLYGVLGVGRPEGGVNYVDETKIRVQKIGAKQEAERAFRAWQLENYYEVDEFQPRQCSSAVGGGTLAAEPIGDFRVNIVKEFLNKRTSLRVLAEKHGLERSLIGYWVAKYKHGELDDQRVGADELSFYKGKVAMLERQLKELSQKEK